MLLKSLIVLVLIMVLIVAKGTSSIIVKVIMILMTRMPLSLLEENLFCFTVEGRHSVHLIFCFITQYSTRDSKPELFCNPPIYRIIFYMFFYLALFQISDVLLNPDTFMIKYVNISNTTICM